MKSTLIIQKKGSFGLFWPIGIFLTSVIAVSIILIALFQNDVIERNSIFPQSVEIYNAIELQKNELIHIIAHSNSKVQEDLLSDILEDISILEDPSFSSTYRSSLITYINRDIDRANRRDFRGNRPPLNVRLDESNLIHEINFQRRNIEVGTTIELPIYYLKEEFIEQARTLNQIENSISRIQSQFDECYQNTFERNECAQLVMNEILSSNNNIDCTQTTQMTRLILECNFIEAPFTSHNILIAPLPRQDGLEGELRIPPSIISTINNEKVINNSVLFTNVEQMESYYVFLIPSETYNLESVINSFENRILQNQNRDRLNIIPINLLLDTFEPHITIKNEDTHTYRIEIDNLPTMYLKVIKNYLQFDIDEEQYVIFSELTQDLNFPHNEPAEIFITQNRFYRDSSTMYGRGTRISLQ